MKITKSKLKEIIMEELNEQPSGCEELMKRKAELRKKIISLGHDINRKDDRGERVSRDEMMEIWGLEDEIRDLKNSEQHKRCLEIEAAKNEVKMTKSQLKQIVKEELEAIVQEDGHEDVPSAVRAMKTIIEDAAQMLTALEQMDGTLPTWWTNKMANASHALNKMRDYLLIDSETISEEEYYHISDATYDDGSIAEDVEFWDDVIEEAEYRGRKVQLNKPMRGDVKKSKVYVRDPKTGNVKKVNFGDPNMRIRKSNPKARKSFRARHNCDNPGPKTKARYWSCKAW